MNGETIVMIAKHKTVLLVAVIALVLAMMGWTLSKQLSGDAGTVPADAGLATTDPASSGSKNGLQGAPATQGIRPDDPGSIFAKPVDPAEEEREHKRIVADFERKFNAEPVDAAWAGKAEPALTKLVSNDGMVVSGLDPADYRSDCRSDTCRISAKFKNQLDADAWASMYTTLTGETFHETRHMVIPQPDGTAELRIYGYRKR